jgi:hypothetical protein
LGIWFATTPYNPWAEAFQMILTPDQERRALRVIKF